MGMAQQTMDEHKTKIIGNPCGYYVHQHFKYHHTAHPLQ